MGRVRRRCSGREWFLSLGTVCLCGGVRETEYGGCGVGEKGEDASTNVKRRGKALGDTK